MKTVRSTITLAAALAVAAPALAQDVPAEKELPTAHAELFDSAGAAVGEVHLQETPRNGVLLRVDVAGLEPGSHAIHIHETGLCEAPTFESAGGHFAPAENAHGLLHENGAHAGDMVNLHVPESGEIEAERQAPHVTLLPDQSNSLLGGDGTAIVIHAGSDDYLSQPSGDAGGRVACGVIRGM